MKKKFVYLKYLNIPNAMTASSLAIGFITLILMFNNHIKIALTLYTLTILLDRFDGMVARKLKMESAFGKELDSLIDFFNFCIVPAIIAYQMSFNSVVSIIIMILYILSGVCRLAHFNLEGMEEIDGEKCFSGVPTTLAAIGFLISASLAQAVSHQYLHLILFLFFVIFAVLMVSPVKCRKNGILIKTIYFLILMAVISLWIL